MKLLEMMIHAFRWLFDKKVLDAINNGATYEEVLAIVHRD